MKFVKKPANNIAVLITILAIGGFIYAINQDQKNYDLFCRALKVGMPLSEAVRLVDDYSINDHGSIKQAENSKPDESEMDISPLAGEVAHGCYVKNDGKIIKNIRLKP